MFNATFNNISVISWRGLAWWPGDSSQTIRLIPMIKVRGRISIPMSATCYKFHRKRRSLIVLKHPIHSPSEWQERVHHVLKTLRIGQRQHRHSTAKQIFKSVITFNEWLLDTFCSSLYVPLVVNTSQSFPHSRFITVFVTRLTRQMPLVEQELLTLLEHRSSPPVFSGVRVTRSLVLNECFNVL